MHKLKCLLAAVLAIAAVSTSNLNAQTVDNPVKVNKTMSLSWDLNPAADEVESYTVHVVSHGGLFVRDIVTTLPPVELVRVLESQANGVYVLTVTATNFAGVSDPSDPLYVFWYGRVPQKPTGLVIRFGPPPAPPLQ
jgi:hypothetical protein